MTLYGIDVSSHQAGLDVGSIEADFVIIKATEGRNYANPELDTHWAQARDAGKLLGLYHFARNDLGDSTTKRPEEEADWFLTTIGDKAAQAIVVLDWEQSSHVGDVAWAKRWLARVNAAVPGLPVLYTYEAATAYSAWAPEAGVQQWPLWVAKFTTATGYDTSAVQDRRPQVDPGVWPAGYVMWQYSRHGRLAGWSNDLDLNECYLTPEQWRELAGIRAPESWEAAIAALQRQVDVLAAQVGGIPALLDKQQADLAAAHEALRVATAEGIASLGGTVGSVAEGVATIAEQLADTVEAVEKNTRVRTALTALLRTLLED